MTGVQTCALPISSVFPHVNFCPTGGIDLNNAADYLALPNVLCVGMSSIATAEAIRNSDFDGIRARAKTAAALSSR